MNLDTQIKNEVKKKENRNLAIKSMENVLSKPSGTPERWRAAFDHFLRQRPDAREDAINIAEYVRERRNEMDKFASTKNGRMAYSTPQWLLQVLKNTDPEYFGALASKDFAGPKHLNLMKKAFPEYFFAEVI